MRALKVLQFLFIFLAAFAADCSERSAFSLMDTSGKVLEKAEADRTGSGPAGVGRRTFPVQFDRERFMKYWNNGQAELSRFRLSQARYGELHPGEAVFIFVLEDFSHRRHVKLESYSSRDDAVSVLKFNTIRKFRTGIYAYSMMNSVFTPLDNRRFPHALKITTGSQEWCGQAFMQFNLRGENYHIRQFSYFENDGDRRFALPVSLTEDELWNRLRLSPELLPRGRFTLIPGTFFVMLRHVNVVPERVTAVLEDYNGREFRGSDLKIYKVRYPEIKRKFEIVFENRFPFKIVGWRETARSGWGSSARLMTTMAVLTHTKKSAYWKKDRAADIKLRDGLGLKY